MKRSILKWLKIIIIFLIIFFVFSLAKCEVNTLLYGNLFTYEYRQTNMIAENQICKVLEFDENWAKVYYYSEYYGNVITFIYDNDKWSMEEWNTVWSRTGSASSVQWPYIWHSIHFNFFE